MQKRWRYVQDPYGTELLHNSGRSLWGQVAGADARPGERGSGDCDDATAYLGSALMSIGLPVRIATIAPPRSRSMFTHVLPMVKIKKLGWLPADPVVYPKHGIGYLSPADRVAVWDLDGRLVSTAGKFPPEFKQMARAGLSGAAPESGGIEMNENYYGATPTNQQWQDHGLDTVGLAGTDSADPEDWGVHVIKGYGDYVPMMGIIDEPQILMEVDEDDEIQTPYGGLVRTQMMEMSPTDYQHVQSYGCPRMGAVALSDDGEVYQYQPNEDGTYGGFFKRLFKRAKKGLKRGWRALKSGAKKLIKRLPGGKYLLKLAGRIHKVAMKLVKPLAKFVGKYAKKLAPIAALIPGYGPAIAAGLAMAGKISKLVNKYGVKVSKKSGKPKFKSGAQAKRFRKALKAAASKLQRKKRKKKRKSKKPKWARGLYGADPMAMFEADPMEMFEGSDVRDAMIAQRHLRSIGERRIPIGGRVFEVGTVTHDQRCRELGLI